MMPALCTVPSRSANGLVDPRYVFGRSCTFHGPIAEAAVSRRPLDVTTTADTAPQTLEVERPCCPGCGGDLLEVATEADHRALLQPLFDVLPEAALLVDWSRGRTPCQPDLGNLEQAYLQAMEGERA